MNNLGKKITAFGGAGAMAVTGCASDQKLPVPAYGDPAKAKVIEHSPDPDIESAAQKMARHGLEFSEGLEAQRARPQAKLRVEDKAEDQRTKTSPENNKPETKTAIIKASGAKGLNDIFGMNAALLAKQEGDKSPFTVEGDIRLGRKALDTSGGYIIAESNPIGAAGILDLMPARRAGDIKSNRASKDSEAEGSVIDFGMDAGNDAGTVYGPIGAGPDAGPSLAKSSQFVFSESIDKTLRDFANGEAGEFINDKGYLHFFPDNDDLPFHALDALKISGLADKARIKIDKDGKLRLELPEKKAIEETKTAVAKKEIPANTTKQENISLNLGQIDKLARGEAGEFYYDKSKSTWAFKPVDKQVRYLSKAESKVFATMPKGAKFATGLSADKNAEVAKRETVLLDPAKIVAGSKGKKSDLSTRFLNELQTLISDKSKLATLETINQLIKKYEASGYKLTRDDEDKIVLMLENEGEAGKGEAHIIIHYMDVAELYEKQLEERAELRRIKELNRFSDG